MARNYINSRMKSRNLYSNSTGATSEVLQKKESFFPFYLVIIYLFLEYGRPQLLIPVLRYLHLPAIVVLLIGLSLLFSGKLYFKDKQTIFFLLLMAEMVIHGPIAVNNYYAFNVFYTMVITFIAYLAIVNIVDDGLKFDKLIKFWLLIFIFLAIIGFIYGGRGVGGFIGDENDFCMALNMILPFTLFGVFSAKNKPNRLYFIVLTCFFLFVIILTKSRGGFVGLITVGFYCWMRSRKKIILAFLIGIFVIFALVIAPPTYWEEVGSITSENTEDNPWGTGAQRIYSWKIGWEMFLDNPIMGVGQGNYPWNVQVIENKLGILWHTRSLGGRAAHSLYFTLFPELGLIGIFLYISLIYTSVKDLRYIKCVSRIENTIYTEEEAKKLYFLSLAMEGSLIAFLASSVFISTLYYPSFWILCAFIVSLKKIVYTKAGDLKLLPSKLAT